MLKNKYIKKIINKVLDNPQRLILPETDDSRIKKAKQKMINIGFNILDLDDFKDHTLYINHIMGNKDKTLNKSSYVKTFFYKAFFIYIFTLL